VTGGTPLLAKEAPVLSQKNRARTSDTIAIEKGKKSTGPRAWVSMWQVGISLQHDMSAPPFIYLVEDMRYRMYAEPVVANDTLS
jgi:hypothetical protein